MDKDETKVFNEMIRLYHGDPKRIQHFSKVYLYAKYIADNENLSDKSKKIIGLAGLVHDIGIHEAEKIYHSNDGKRQEICGPPIAVVLLKKCGIDDNIISEVCKIVGSHHTYFDYDTIEHRVIVEADFIVNLYEDNANQKAIESVETKIFKTETGKKLLEEMFF